MANHRKYSIVAFTCEACGVSFERKNNRVYRFCSPKCRAKALNVKDPSKWTVYTCKNCGKQFEDWVYRNTGYCSRVCAHKYAASCPRPNYHRQEHGGKVTWNCKQCGKEMRTFKSREQDCCSQKCAYLYWPQSKYVSFTCKSCGKTKMVPPYKQTCLHRMYCDKICAGKAHSQKVLGQNNANWKGGFSLAPRGINWKKQSCLARKRDGYTCQVCQKVGIQVHHIVPFRLFGGDWKRANVLSNLITLCASCHSKVEHHKIPCPTPKP